MSDRSIHLSAPAWLALACCLVGCGAVERPPRATPTVASSAPPRVDVFALAPAEIQSRLGAEPDALGSVSLGRPNGGALFGAVRMPEGDLWTIVDTRHAWATQETVDYLVRAIRAADRRSGGGDKLFVGQLSRRSGGRLWPHASHQSGRDVDLGYYYLPGTRGGWYQQAAKVNLDCARTWALLRAMVVHTDVEHIFISRSVQKLLKQHALDVGEDPEWLASIFSYGSAHPAPLIRNAMGHATHMHVRFFNPRAQHLGLHAHQVLAAKTRHGARIAPMWDVPIPERRLPPTATAVTATN